MFIWLGKQEMVADGGDNMDICMQELAILSHVNIIWSSALHQSMHELHEEVIKCQIFFSLMSTIGTMGKMRV